MVYAEVCIMIYKVRTAAGVLTRTLQEAIWVESLLVEEVTVFCRF
jgi:hypothetical protein